MVRTPPLARHHPHGAQMERIDASLGSDTAALLGALDALEVGFALFDPTGTPLFRNGVLTRLLDCTSGGAGLRTELDRLVRVLVKQVRDGDLRGTQGVERLATREVEVGGSRFLLGGSYVGFNFWRHGATLLVIAERQSSSMPSDEALRGRFGLSRQEVRVARLLADGRSNAEIAKDLHLSPHTARNYTRRVLERLGVRSRAQVGPRLRGG